MSQILDQVISEFKEREERGVKKYGTTMDRKDLNFEEWVQHLREELMDALLYLTKIKNENGTQRFTDSEKENHRDVETHSTD
jgi:hypothetical protein